MNLERSEYLAGLHRAYLGEVGGAAFASALRAKDATPVQGDALGLFEALELATGRILAPLLPVPPTPDVMAEAEARGKSRACRTDWAGLIHYAAYRLDIYIEEFRFLWAAAPASEREALALLVAHEVALRDFGRAALTDPADGVTCLRSALAEAEQYLAASG